MAKNERSDGKGNRSDESMSSGRMGERNRNTPGRSPSELGLDPEEARGHDLLGAASIQGDARPGVSDAPGEGNLVGGSSGEARRNPPLIEDADVGDGGLSASGGVAGGARGHAGTSDRGAGGPLGDMRSGPGQHKSTSRGDLDHGTNYDPDRGNRA